MAKSPLAKNSKQAIHVRNSKNVFPLHFTIPYKVTQNKTTKELDVSNLLHFRADIKNKKIESRIICIRNFCKKSKEYFDNANSAKTLSSLYDSLKQYIKFCDAVNVNPFSETGYLKYAGNDGELRHRIKAYKPSRKLWERQHGEEIGIKESSVSTTLGALRTALSFCGSPVELWRIQHRGFSGEKTPIKGYSDAEEQLLVSRLSELFFALALQLIAVKENNLILPDELAVTVDLDEYQEVIYIPTSLKANQGKQGYTESSIKASAAFNMAMGAAYHLICFFTSLNDTNVKAIAHPIRIHTDERDKNLQTIRVSSFKTRSNKQVDSLFTNDTDESLINFDVDKRDGVTFIKTLEKLSILYGNNEEGAGLLFSLNGKGVKSNSFPLIGINRNLVSKLNLVSPYRSSCLPWFEKLFYSYRNDQVLKLKTTVNELGRAVVSKEIIPIKQKYRTTHGTKDVSYCILSCYTNLPLKNIMLPLSYSKKDSDGNITVSFKYLSGHDGRFKIPAQDKELIQDIELFSTEQADKQTVKKYSRLLLKKGHSKEPPRSWKGFSPISSNRIKQWGIDPSDYFISLQSSRWREMTSSQEYDDSNIGLVQSILQNNLDTINKHYANGDPLLNKTILSQGIQVIEQLANNFSLVKAKENVITKLAIPMLAYDEWLKKKKKDKAKTNPNGITCNGQQNIEGGKNSQRETSKAIGVKLPCAEYDMCYKCKSAKAVDEVQAVYKLISFIDTLKEVLDQFTHVKKEVIEKINAYEYTLDGTSPNVYKEAMKLFEKNGRHPRVSADHAILSLYNH